MENISEKIKVLGIIGSPRRQGNTETLVDEVLAGAKEAGADCEKIVLNELHVEPCQACETCIRTGKCKIKDDMNIINEKMNESTVFVLGTPIYYWGPTGQFKAFFDRLLATSKLGYIKGKQVILTIPLGGSEPIARHTVGMLTDALNYLNANIHSKIISPSTMEIGDVKKKKEVMRNAKEAGREIVLKIQNKN